ncbi:MAG: hypothetical protein ABL925_08055 [Methylococcales bacterium]
MKLPYAVLSIFILLGFNDVSLAYGGGSSSSKACAKPKFSDFIPEENAGVKAGAEFSFTASANTHPESIKVTVKELPVTVQIDDRKGTAFKVSGKLPDSLSGSYARININAEASNACKGSGGWLVKIEQ